MCWSFEASIFTWVVAIVTAIYLISRRKKNDIIMGILILTYTFMQFWESLMWLDQKNCGKLNKFATMGAYYTLWIHMLALGIGIYIEYKIPYVLWLGLGLMGLAVVLQPKQFQCSLKASNGHLSWGFNPTYYMYVFVLMILVVLAIIRPVKYAVIISSLFIISLLISFLFGNWQDNTVGSFWCWIAAFFCFVSVAI